MADIITFKHLKRFSHGFIKNLLLSLRRMDNGPFLRQNRRLNIQNKISAAEAQSRIVKKLWLQRNISAFGRPICSTIPWSLAKKDIKDDGSIIHDCRFSSIMHNIWQYGNTGCGIFKGGLENQKSFGLKIQQQSDEF